MATHLKFVSVHVILCILLAFSQPVDCIFWPTKKLNWPVAATELHINTGGHVALLSGPTVHLLCDDQMSAVNFCLPKDMWVN